MFSPNKVKEISSFVGAYFIPPQVKAFGMYHKRSKKDPRLAKVDTWFFKRYSEETLAKTSPEGLDRAEIAPRIEATISDMYGWMMGRNFVPKVRPIKKEGKTLWIASKNIESDALDRGTEPYKTGTGSNRHYSAKAYCTTSNARSLAAVLISSYIFEEYDLSWTGIRRTPSDEFARIDMGMSLWSISCQYKFDRIGETYIGTEPDQERSYYDNVKPKDAIPINAGILKDLPHLKFGDHDYKPYNSVQVQFENDAAKAEFSLQKWKYCLKALLLNEVLLKSSADQFLEDSCPVKKQILDHMKERLQSLKSCLISIPEFNECMISNMDSFKADLFKELEAYNASKKPKDPSKFKTGVSKLIDPVWESLITEGRRALILNSQNSRNILITALKGFVDSEINRLNPSPYTKPVQHEKIIHMRTQRDRLYALSDSPASHQIQTACQIIHQLDSISAMPIGCIERFTHQGEKNWQAFKLAQINWIRAFTDANTILGNVYSNTSVLRSLKAEATEGTPLLQAK
jgi:hypothetical protein